MNAERGSSESGGVPEHRITRPEYGVLGRVQDVFGNGEVTIAPRLLTDIASGNIDTVVWLGPPGTGKTTCRVQLQKYVEQELGKTVNPVLYDDVLYETSDALNMRDEIWGPDEWQEFSQRFRDRLEARGPHHITSVETVAVGAETRDRGRTALADFCQDAEHAEKTAIFCMVPDRTINKTARVIRREILTAHDPKDIVTILKGHNIHISGMPRANTERQKKVRGEQLKSVYQKMAPPEWIERIDSEITEWCLEHLLERMPSVGRIHYLEERLKSGPRLSDYEYDLTVSELEYLYLRRDAVYMQHIATSIPNGQVRVVYNKHIQQDIVLPWSDLVSIPSQQAKS